MRRREGEGDRWSKGGGREKEREEEQEGVEGEEREGGARANDEGGEEETKGIKEGSSRERGREGRERVRACSVPRCDGLCFCLLVFWWLKAQRESGKERERERGRGREASQLLMCGPLALILHFRFTLHFRLL